MNVEVFNLPVQKLGCAKSKIELHRLESASSMKVKNSQATLSGTHLILLRSCTALYSACFASSRFSKKTRLYIHVGAKKQVWQDEASFTVPMTRLSASMAWDCNPELSARGMCVIPRWRRSSRGRSIHTSAAAFATGKLGPHSYSERKASPKSRDLF